MPGRWGRTPFAALLSCLILGIATASLPAGYLFCMIAVGAAALIVAAIISLHRKHLSGALGLSLASIALGGFLNALAYRDGYPDHDIRARISRDEIPFDGFVPFDGCVSDDGQKRDGEIVNTIDLRAIRTGGGWSRTTGRMILRTPESTLETPEPLSLREGDRVRGWAAWHPPRNFLNPGLSDHSAFLARRGVYLLGRVKSPRLLEVIPGDCRNAWGSLIFTLRNRVQATLEELSRRGKENQAAILSAVLLGDYSNLSTAVREAFQNSGTYHVLVVSGLHVTWIAWVLIGLSHFCGMSKNAGWTIAASGIFVYSCMVGFQASISRSLWMFLLYLLGKLLFRRAAPANIAMASAFLLLIVRPDWLFDAGFQLSFLSVLAICLMGAPVIEHILTPLFDPAIHAGENERLFLKTGRAYRIGRRLRCLVEIWAEGAGDRWSPGWERVSLRACRILATGAMAVSGMIVISMSVQVWLEPLLAHHFNRLSWIAPVANLIVVPLSSAVLAAGLLSALASGIPVISSALNAASSWLALVLYQSASWISGLPGAWQRCPTPTAAWVVAGILIVSSWCFMEWRRKWVPWVFIGALLASLSAGSVPMGGLAHALPGRRPDLDEDGLNPASLLQLSFLDVGEGDSIVIRFPDGRVWVMDAGGIRQGRSRAESERVFDIGEAVVSRYLWHRWITRIDRMVLSHTDVDHAGGVPAILRNFKVSRLEYGGAAIEPLMTNVFDAAAAKSVPATPVHAWTRETVAGVLVETLNPPEGEPVGSTNEGSVVLHFSHGRFSCLLTGDLERSAESRVVARTGDMRSLLLKVAHHGSRWATMDPLLDQAHPRWGIISVGRNNPFGHPSREVVERLLRHRIRPLLTLDQGAITFATDGTRYKLLSYVAGILESGLLPDPTPN